MMQLDTFTEGGLFAPGRIANTLRTTKEEVARTVGLGRDALLRSGARPFTEDTKAPA